MLERRIEESLSRFSSGLMSWTVVGHAKNYGGVLPPLQIFGGTLAPLPLQFHCLCVCMCTCILEYSFS